MSNLTIVTGPAGVGKSFHLSQKVKELTAMGKRVVVCAPTGIAARNVNGVTIHKLFGVYNNKPTMGFSKKESLRKADYLVIDEFSMVGEKLLNLMSDALKEIMNNNQPFGGKNVFMYGDILQIPPINENYFFDSSDFKVKDWHVIYFNEVKRQDDKTFIDILNKVRTGDLSLADLKYLTDDSSQMNDSRLTLFPKRVDVQKMNNDRLDKLEGAEYQFSFQEVEGDDKAILDLFKSILTPQILRLKKEARIMTTVNDPAGRFMNGSQGVFKDFNAEDQCLTIELDDGKTVKVERIEMGNYNEFNPCIIKQFPISLAYSLTIHKAQGLTLDNYTVDFSGYWGSPSMVYVGLSRAKSRAGLFVKNLDLSFITVDKKAQNFERILKCKHTDAPGV